MSALRLRLDTNPTIPRVGRPPPSDASSSRQLPRVTYFDGSPNTPYVRLLPGSALPSAWWPLYSTPP